MFKVRGRRPRKKLPFSYVFVLTILLFIGMTTWGLRYINHGIKPTLRDIAETRATQIATYAINIAVGKKEIRDMELEMNQTGASASKKQLFIPTYDDAGNITSFTYNTVAINQLNNLITNDVQEYLRLIEEGKTPISNPTLGEVEKTTPNKQGLVDKVPLGQATNNVLLANLGPNIPIRFQVMSNIQTNNIKEVKSVPINNVWVDVSIQVVVHVKIVIPFEVKTVTVTNNIPIVTQLIPGQVPIYWGGNNSSNPSVVLPDQSSNKSSTNSKGNVQNSKSTSKASNTTSSSTTNKING